jgi:hypothetical protein
VTLSKAHLTEPDRGELAQPKMEKEHIAEAISKSVLHDEAARNALSPHESEVIHEKQIVEIQKVKDLLEKAQQAHSGGILMKIQGSMIGMTRLFDVIVGLLFCSYMTASYITGALPFVPNIFILTVLCLFSEKLLFMAVFENQTFKYLQRMSISFITVFLSPLRNVIVIKQVVNLILYIMDLLHRYPIRFLQWVFYSIIDVFVLGNPDTTKSTAAKIRNTIMTTLVGFAKTIVRTTGKVTAAIYSINRLIFLTTSVGSALAPLSIAYLLISFFLQLLCGFEGMECSKTKALLNFYPTTLALLNIVKKISVIDDISSFKTYETLCATDAHLVHEAKRFADGFRKFSEKERPLNYGNIKYEVVDLMTQGKSLKTAFRLLSKKYHPDKGGSEIDQRTLNSIYEEMSENRGHT